MYIKKSILKIVMKFPKPVKEKMIRLYMLMYGNFRKKMKWKRCVKYLTNDSSASVRAFGNDLRKAGKMEVYVGEWREKYRNQHCKIEKDKKNNLFFSVYTTRAGDREKVYFPRSFSKSLCEVSMVERLMEQDKESPHCYLPEGWRGGGRVLDLGCSEGIFALDTIQSADFVYCFEPEEEWQEPLATSLAPYKGKHSIIKKFVSNMDEGEMISIDGFFGKEIPENISLIKMDIEGFEIDALNGMMNTLERNPQAVLLICAYHKKEDESKIRAILEPMGYTIYPRKGYMLFQNGGDFTQPYIRHGVLECRKKLETDQKPTVFELH